ncbi:uncharacterized protein LOC123521431 isoform X2 [Echinops telfairi]|uniref:Uncharacterized protein LOC123521431 isoform X2 n=1 Tax=Echinops telfairi TaxID=9371 RepID=A0AC55CWQ0_ECHTE|nr:uncharacterized protein LOC123521431 isoform X2 [Echinops telfairi]
MTEQPQAAWPHHAEASHKCVSQRVEGQSVLARSLFSFILQQHCRQSLCTPGSSPASRKACPPPLLFFTPHLQFLLQPTALDLSPPTNGSRQPATRDPWDGTLPVTLCWFAPAGPRVLFLSVFVTSQPTAGWPCSGHTGGDPAGRLKNRWKRPRSSLSHYAALSHPTHGPFLLRPKSPSWTPPWDGTSGPLTPNALRLEEPAGWDGGTLASLGEVFKGPGEKEPASQTGS